ncbi:AAA family ATPase [Dactylosporangium fulvum]|uniref:AAA family ATPase n=1 Tax=Dactylosporangium fulvum TaxID=53359 RepID=A0ABY5WD94_9ACTN|nr:BTAD domain-containing putative transcriptional regulator [Dactylosporangium fulvum]UWP87564.1 AAA family ATPase [Dactylosporangium fulvum]
MLRDGDAVPVGGPKPQALLALLLLRPNRFVAADWLVDALWDGTPPASAHVTLRTYVAGLRRALEPGRGPRAEGRVLVGHNGGYELRVPPGAVDAERFADLTEAAGQALAAGDPVAAERDYTEALALWRGAPAVGDLAAARADVARLTEARLAAEEGRFTAAVAAGRHRAVLPQLRRFVLDHPAREAACEQLMLALYRSGQQAAALTAYDVVRRHLADEFGVEPGAPLRDLHRRVLGHTVAPVGPVAPVSRRPALVGRDAELARLGELLAAAGRDGGRVVAVTGEAGIGKTSLAAAAADRAAADGTPVVWGRCPDLGQAPPFWLWTQVVRGLLALPGAAGHDSPAALAGFTAATPGGADGGPAGLIPGPPGGAEGVLDPVARFRTYEALADLVRGAAAPAGLVVVLDDLHAADVDSLLLLRFLATGLQRSRTLVIGTLRPYEHDPAVVAALADLARVPGSARLHLTGLDATSVADLVRRRTGAPAATGLARRLAERTGGNPFFLTELLATPDPAAEGDPPPGVRDAVRQRLLAPGPAVRYCLDLLAVAGRELDLRLLATATGDGAAGAGDLAELLAAPAAAHLVAEAGPGAVRFRHPLFAEVAYAELAAPRRAVLHARLAGAAAALPDRSGLTPGELAHHYGQSIGLGHGADFLRWTRRAAEDATRRLAYEDALAHLDRAAAHLSPEAGTSPGTAAAELDVRLHQTSLLQITVGVGSDAVARVAARARALLPLAGADADLHTALWTLGEVACNRAEYPIGEHLAGRLVRAAPHADGLVAAAGPYLLGAAAYFTGRLDEAERQLSVAADRLAGVAPAVLRRQVGRTPTLAPYNFRALVRSLRGDAAAAQADLEAAGALAEHCDDPYGRGNAVLFAAWTALQAHDVDAGRAAARRCREIGARQHMPHFVSTGDFLADWAAARGGDRGRLAPMRAAADGLYRHGLRATRTISVAAMADAHLVAGDPHTAAALADEGLALAAETGERVLTAELRRVRGLATGDDADLRAAAEIAGAQGARLLLQRVAGCRPRPADPS